MFTWLREKSNRASRVRGFREYVNFGTKRLSASAQCNVLPSLWLIFFFLLCPPRSPTIHTQKKERSENVFEATNNFTKSSGSSSSSCNNSMAFSPMRPIFQPPIDRCRRGRAQFISAHVLYLSVILMRSFFLVSVWPILSSVSTSNVRVIY